MVIPLGALSGTCEVSEKKSEDRYSGKSSLRLQKQACLAQIEKCSHSDNFQREFTEEALDTKRIQKALMVQTCFNHCPFNDLTQTIKAF